MHHYELARPYPEENAHLAGPWHGVWVRWGHRGFGVRRELSRHEAAVELANWRRAAVEEPERFRLYRRSTPT
jgi:hypothetical protein